MPEPDTNNVAIGIEEFAKQSRLRLKIVEISSGVAMVLLSCVIAVAIHIAIHASEEIQASRVSNCVAQNKRHDKTLAYILSFPHTTIQGASERVIVQDISPKQNCAKSVKPK